MPDDQLSLLDLGNGTYKTFPGGLYGNGNLHRPPAHQAAGLAIADSIQPLNAAGAPDSTHAFAIAPRTTIFEDSFETDQGWTIGTPADDATAGIWVREEPVGTFYQGYPIQPEFDHSPDPAEICFVTGNGSTDPDSSDIDGGRTTLFSPVIDLSGCLTASVSYWVWFSNHRGDNPGEDSWVVKASSGDGWVHLESTVAAS